MAAMTELHDLPGWSLTMLAWVGILGVVASLAGAVLISLRDAPPPGKRRRSRPRSR